MYLSRCCVLYSNVHPDPHMPEVLICTSTRGAFQLARLLLPQHLPLQVACMTCQSSLLLVSKLCLSATSTTCSHISEPIYGVTFSLLFHRLQFPLSTLACNPEATRGVGTVLYIVGYLRLCSNWQLQPQFPPLQGCPIELIVTAPSYEYVLRQLRSVE